MAVNPGKGGPLIIVDGLPKSGVGTLAQALWLDLGIPYNANSLYPGNSQNLQILRRIVEEADHGPILVPRLLLTPAAEMEERWESDRPRLTPEEWSTLDSWCARRNARILCLVDNPASIESRIPEYERPYWPRERIGRWLQSVNLALSASSVARKGSYILPQFLDPVTGEKTDQYRRLLGVLKGEIEAARCTLKGAERGK